MTAVSYMKRHWTWTGIPLPVVAAWTCQHQFGQTTLHSTRTVPVLVHAPKWPIGHPISHHHRSSSQFYQVRLFSSTSTSTANEFKQTMDSTRDDDDIYKDLKWLSQEIRRHDQLYYSQQPELSDDEFDALVQREERLSNEYPHLLERWQKESGWGIAATRKGRVGSTIATDDNQATIFSTSRQGTDFLPSEPRLKRKHLMPMLSLDNVHNDEQLWAWIKRIPKVLDEWDSSEPMRVTILTEPKLDGVSLALRYQRQPQPHESEASYKLQWASTRGDGQQGQDVTSAVLSMNQTIPSLFTTKHSHLPKTIEIRGEVIMPVPVLEQMAELAPNATFSNARNAASGILLRKESEDESEQIEAQQLRSKLLFYAYDMVADPQEQPMALDGDVIQNILADLGFTIPSPVAKTELDVFSMDTTDDWSNETISPMLSYYEALQGHRDQQRETKGYDWGEYEMDGCVHKVVQYEIRKLLGRSMKSPKWAVAHKFPPRAVVTKLLDITVQVGRTGALTPVAILEPVEVGGVTIQRATLHNFGHLQEVLGGNKTEFGTSVLVRRAGDVIPQVVKRVGDPCPTENRNMISLEAPTKCPACGSPIIVEDVASSGIGQVIRCGGPPLLCPPRAVTSLSHAFSRDAMDVTGLSEARIQQLMDAGLLRFPGDIFKFGDEQWEQVQQLPGWGPKSCQNLRSASQRVATTGISLSRFIYSLGVRHLGKHSSELVAAHYSTKKAFLEALDAAVDWIEPKNEDCNEVASQPFSSLQGQLGIGPVLIQSLITFAKTKELVAAAKELGQVVLVSDENDVYEVLSFAGTTGSTEKKSGGKHPWRGFRVVFTGSIPGFSRSEAQKAAKLLGAKATPASVSKSTDLVIVGEKGGKKSDQAVSLGIQIMSAEEFAEFVAKNLQTTE